MLFGDCASIINISIANVGDCGLPIIHLADLVPLFYHIILLDLSYTCGVRKGSARAVKLPTQPS
jgi:hypothetical protein